MFLRKMQMPQHGMPTAEEFALWGARELSFEELLEVNGGRHVIDDPSTDDVSDTIANGGSSPGGSSSSSNSGGSSDGSSGSTGGSSGNSDSSGGSSGTNDSSPPASSSPSEPVTGGNSDDTGGGYTDYWEGACTDWYESGGSSGGGSSNGSSGSSDNHSSDSGSSDDSWGGSSDNDSSDSGGSYIGGSYTGGGYTYTPPVQNQEPSAPDSPDAQGQELPNTGGMPSVPQQPDVQAPANPEPKKGWGEKIRDWFDGKGNKTGFGRIADTFFKNDGAKTIHTIGGAASGTVTMVSGAAGAGIYVNPKNDNLFNLSSKLLMSTNPVARTTGAVLTVVNIEDIGGYAGAEAGAGTGVSGSLAMTAGSFKSKEDMAGPYCARGGSGGAGGLSGGGDMIFNMDGECIGALASFGASVDLTRFEGHTRWGVTGVTSFMKKTVTAP